MTVFRTGRYAARLAQTQADLRRCQRLRHLAFIEARGLGRRAGAVDSDEFDARCRHVMVEQAATGTLVCCYRILALNDGSEIARSYSARHYDLERLARYPGRMVEMGRFCVHPAWRDPNIVRTAWGAMSRVVDETGVELIFGCSSFHGVDAEAYRDAFALLGQKHLAPRRWLPRVKAPEVFRFARRLAPGRPDIGRALRLMPPLLRSYLLMGGWVSDHAVIDAELNTLHVFTGIEVSRVPEARVRLMRRAAA
ncbi:MAG TPA: GNAT family N-acyltransferase [Thermohalobaculum sp.]|nr:GNAT family N-acyltransferase [Thermohalobaculum sp.]